MTLAPVKNPNVTPLVQKDAPEERPGSSSGSPKGKLIILGVIIAVLVAITLLKATLSGDSVTKVHADPVPVRAIHSSILASGELGYEHQALLTSELIGMVKAVHVQEGDVVKRGLLVLEIDDEAYIADVAQQQAQLRAQEVAIERAEVDTRQAEREVARSHKLYESHLVTAEFQEERKLGYDRSLLELKAARTQYDLAREELRKSRNRLQKTRILSPMDGVAIAVDIKVGETAVPSAIGIPGSSLMTIADPKSIYAKVYVDEADIANLRVGNRVQVVVTSAADRPAIGRVDRIATSGRVAAGRQGLSFAVGITFEDPDPELLRPGVSCRAEIFVTGREEVLAALIQAVQTEESGTTSTQYVFVVRDGSAERVNVKTGLADDEYIEIVSGLTASDQLITGPATALQTLRTGDKVTVSNDRL